MIVKNLSPSDGVIRQYLATSIKPAVVGLCLTVKTQPAIE